MNSPGQRFRTAIEEERPLQIIGVINAYVAIMAKYAGFKALYLSGAGVANSSHGLPDLGVITLNDVLCDASRIIAACNLPLLVDIDTGWGNGLMIARTIKAMERAGVAAVHIEDQIPTKRCGHRAGKQLVSTLAMADRLKAAADARNDKQFVIMARTDALAVEGLPATVARALAYVEAGADMIFLEAATTLSQYEDLKKAVGVPLLANLTEFGQTPLWHTHQLAQVGVDMALYPLSINRAMNLAALKTLKTIREHGSQHELLGTMQTREELYGFLNYDFYESECDNS
jgi:methylisocitrate lyase